MGAIGTVFYGKVLTHQMSSIGGGLHLGFPDPTGAVPVPAVGPSCGDRSSSHVVPGSSSEPALLPGGPQAASPTP